jgi:site-specific DNA-methyltransferase (adenine-specific)/site-specific DNA-methyltransferase (cytosine-N4-specific)
MEGVKMNVAFTSPPYADRRKYDPSSGFNPIPPDEYVDWFRPISANVKTHLAHDGSWFVNIKPSATGLDSELYVFDLVIAHARQWGWHFATEFCWERVGIPKSVTRRFKNQFEPVYQFTLGEWKMRPDAVRHESASVPKARGKGAGNTSWAEHQGSINMSGHQGEPGFKWFGDNVEPGLAYPGNRLPTFSASHEALGHAAAFPVGLPSFFIKAYSDSGDSIYEPFCGSGTTIIAAEQLGRKCYGMEISPQYCDIIVKRWELLTGKTATRESAE